MRVCACIAVGRASKRRSRRRNAPWVCAPLRTAARLDRAVGGPSHRSGKGIAYCGAFVPAHSLASEPHQSPQPKREGSLAAHEPACHTRCAMRLARVPNLYSTPSSAAEPFGNR